MVNRRYFYLLYALIIALSTFSGFFRLGSITYLAAVILFLLLPFLASSARFPIRLGSGKVLLLLFICFISILINNPPSYFRVWERLLLFTIVLLAFSPLTNGIVLNRNRILLFDSLIYTMLLFSVASFIGYFFGINFFTLSGELLEYSEAGHFSGFTYHSMALAPISSLSALLGLSKILSLKSEETKKTIWWIITPLCYGAVFLSASRGALAGVIFASAIAVYRHSGARMGKFLRYSLHVIALASFTFPIWGGLTESVIEKNKSNMSQGGFMYSRETKMAARLYEIRNNFLTGVGFSVVDESVDYVDRETGTIEPNSSWLCVFSMTGLFGFVVFLLIYINSFKTAYKKITNTEKSVFLCSVLAFFFVHMMVEGYVFAAGSFLCGTYWLTLGVVHAYAKLYVQGK